MKVRLAGRSARGGLRAARRPWGVVVALAGLSLGPSCASARRVSDFVSVSDAASDPAPDPVARPAGEKLFASYCVPCHRADGLGVERAGPPLHDSPWVRGSPARLVRILLHGVGGPLDVAGRTYALEMPSFGPILPDRDIAALLSWVRSRFGGGSPPITEDRVADVREQTAGRTSYWTAAELLALP